MTTYKAIKGQNIRVLSSDPSNLALGDVWYNSTSNTVKARAKSAAWAVGASITGSGRSTGFAAGTADAGFIAGGRPGGQSATSEYNGTSFSAGGTMNYGRNTGGKGGTLSSGIAAAGGPYPPGRRTEEYNGTCWSVGGDVPTTGLPRSANYGCSGAGTSENAAWITGGGPGGEGAPGWTSTYQYNGTSWTSSGASRSIRWTAAAAGTESAGLYFGGYNYAAYSTNSEEYNGSVFTEGNNMPASRGNMGGAGTQGSAGVMGGAPGYSAVYSVYDGTSWATGGSMPTPNTGCKGFGADNKNVICGGFYTNVPAGYSTTGFAYVESDATVTLTTS